MHRILSQVAGDESAWEVWIEKLSLPLLVVLFGIALIVLCLWVLRGRQTPSDEMPKHERWLVVCLVGCCAGVIAVGLIRVLV